VLEVLRGPLPEPWRSEAIAGWGRYDPRLLDADEWRLEFEEGPEGPAVHALVLTPDGHVAGHHAAIPLRLRAESDTFVVGKGEALYVDAERRERGARVDVDGRPLRLAEALTSGLYARYQDFGLETYFGFATPEAEVRHVAAGCKVVVLPYRRFLLFHDPSAALARSASPFARGIRGAAVKAFLGMHARTARARMRLAQRRRSPDEAAEVESFLPELDDAFRAGLEPSALSLDPSAEQLNWRFPSSLYRLFVLGSPPWGYAVALRADKSSARARVVDWLLPLDRVDDAVGGVVALLAESSATDGAAALEWIVPSNSEAGGALAEALGRTPLLADRRRSAFRMVVHGDDRFTRPERWALTLSTQERF
jgi:hypothetical protein